VPYIPGSPIDAYCTNCKSDTSHIVLDVDGVQVREVRCESCDATGEFRTPKAKTRALKAAIKRKTVPPPPRKRTRKKVQTPEEIYQNMIKGLDLTTAMPYSIKTELNIGDLVDHPKFGVGIVETIADIQKAKIVFEDGERVMVCNRK